MLSGAIIIATPESLPVEILGTEVKDEASGFRGTAISLTLHINGCVHVGVRATGTQNNGAAIKTQDFDIRRLSGSAIKKLSAEEKRESQMRHPSPAPVPPLR